MPVTEKMRTRMRQQAIVVVVAALVVVSCEKPMSGKLIATQPQGIPIINQDGEFVHLQSAPATVRVNKSATGEVLIAVETKLQKALIVLPRELAVADPRYFTVDAEQSHQPIDLSAATRYLDAGTLDRVEKVACRTGSNNGLSCAQDGLNLSWNPNCPGMETVRNTYAVTREYFAIEFTAANTLDHELLGVFAADPVAQEKLIASKPLSVCRLTQ